MFYIYIDPTEDKFAPGIKLSRLLVEATGSSRVPDKLQQEFASWLADTMAEMLVDYINLQHYLGRWTPLSPAYKEWKESVGLSTDIWIATGTLRDSIRSKKISGGYSVGPDPHAEYENGVSVLDVARWMEFGTSRMPARPLFGPVTDNIRKHSRAFLKRFLAEKTWTYYKMMERALKEL